MTERNHWLKPLAWMAVAAIAVTAALGAGRNTQATVDADNGRTLFPKSRIISFNDSVGLLDTQTGAIYEVKGDLVNARQNVSAWEIRVQPVKGHTSGLLEIQRATFNNPGATFLVDVVTGRTWLLKRDGPRETLRNGHGHARWSEIKVYD